MSGANEKFRFYLPAVLLVAGALGIGVRLVLLHLSLVTAHTKQPDYGFTRNTQGCRGAIYCMGGREVLAQTKTVWDYHVDAQAATILGIPKSRSIRRPVVKRCRRSRRCFRYHCCR